MATSAFAAPPAPRHDALPIEGAVVNPDWISKPSGEDVSRFYPPLPQNMGLSGKAVLTCSVSALGILEGCSVSGEIPVGMGFGAATLQLAPYFHMRPRSLDGAPVGGAQVRIPIRFMFAHEDAPAPNDSASRPPSEKALALSRRILAVEGGPTAVNAKVSAAVAAFEQQLKESNANATSTPEAQVAFSALRQAYAAAASSYLERLTTIYAQSLDEAQLSQAVAFVESPAGRALAKAQQDAADRSVGSQAAFEDDVRKDALKRFCAVVVCLPDLGVGKAPAVNQGRKP